MSVVNHIPRVSLTHAPTPLEFAPRLSELLEIELWIKRDDCTGLGGGGNKTRKLEFLVADAQEKRADTLVTLGGIQSNHARQTAAAAAKFGFDCELVLQAVEGTPKTNYSNNGNRLLDQLFGANIHSLNETQDIECYAQNLMQQLSLGGKRPYLIPIGGSNVIGSLGYVQCAFELHQQVKSLATPKQSTHFFEHLIHATGSAGTQAGLLAGLMASQQSINVMGINVSRDESQQNALVLELLKNLVDYLQLRSEQLGVNDLSKLVNTYGDYYGTGYGVATKEMVHAVATCARLEGILLDPVYSGKAMVGLFDLCQKKQIQPGSRVLFLHTGGSTGLFAYQEVFD